MKKLIFLFFILSKNIFADSNLDSLKKVLQIQIADTSRAITLVTMAISYNESGKFDSAHKYYNEAISVCKKVSDIKFMAMAYFYKAKAYVKANDFANAKIYYNKALSVYLKINRYPRIADTYNAIGLVNYFEGKYDSAIPYFNNSIKFAEKTNDAHQMGVCYNNLGIMYDVLGNKIKSVESYLQAVKIYEKNKMEELSSGPYQNISLIYYNNKQYKEALENLKKAEDISIKYNDEDTRCRVYNTMGAVLDMQGKIKEANEIFVKAYELAKKLKDDYLLALSLTNLGENCLFVGKYDEAEKILLQCVEAKKKLNNMVSLGITEIALGQTYVKKEKYALAIKYYNEGLSRVKEAAYLDYEKIAYEGLAASFGKLGKFKEAFHNLNDYVKINDTILKASNNKIMSELQTKYESDKKETEIKLLTKNQQLSDVELKRKAAEVKFAIGVGGLVFILLIIVFFSWRNKQKANKELAEKNDEINLQKTIVEEKQKEIIDSITYAKRIQSAILATEQDIKKQFPESFLLYLPKDIVAGDFYFFENTNTHVFYAAADCTGHGVPGALVSVVCANALMRCIKEFNLNEPGKILDKARELVLETFKKSGQDVKDGMDISLLVKNIKTSEYSWAGANNPLWILVSKTSNDILEVKADKQPIGLSENPLPFKTHPLQLNKGDSVFLITDGYADQFGGPKGKKFKYKHLKEDLVAIQNKSSEEQKEILNKTFEEWKGNLEQVDDVCVIGIRI